MALLTDAAVRLIFGDFHYREHPKIRGMIVPDTDWEAQNIRSIDAPWEMRDSSGHEVKAIRCHRAMIPHLRNLFEDIATANLRSLLTIWDGCYVPRHMNWNPAKPLSRHSWGVAVDVNARLFPYGSFKKQSPKLIEFFAGRGFAWGGGWRWTRDPMHFELVYVG